MSMTENTPLTFESDQRIHIPNQDLPDWVTVRVGLPRDDGGWDLFVALDDGTPGIVEVKLTAAEASAVTFLEPDAGAESSRVLAGMWTRWMAAAATNAQTTLLASSPLRPYAHQANAVYGAMLPQPWLRFLLADEPGTGKTIMAGLYLREMQRQGLLRKALVVAPANLVSKWQDDFGRFFGGGLRRITADTVREHALDVDHDLWVVSLELAAVNGAVQEAIRPDRAGWDVVVFDEAHRLTPTAQTFHRVGRLLAGAPRALLMTATPHRGKEWLFRHLLHLVDPDIYPDPGDDPTVEAELSKLRPGSIHFLRRMKEDLVDYDEITPLFKGRHATNHRIPLALPEYAIYQRALELVDSFFQPAAQPLARMVYGKRAASSLYALRETLHRRDLHMGELSEAEAAAEADPYDEDEAARDEARVINADSVSAREERRAIRELVATIDETLSNSEYTPSKWRTLIDDCLRTNGIKPGTGEQAVIFTEYADTAEWLTKELAREGFDAQMYSGRLTHRDRDEVRAAFIRAEFQIIVSTDAGNEGIDLQTAHVLVNFDIPWSLVRLEQRMGRIHRVGQHREVELFNLVADDTREGATLHVLLENFVTAANELDGQMFDSLSLVAELSGVHYEEWLNALYGDNEAKKAEAVAAARRVNAQDLRRIAQQTRESEADLASKVDAMAAVTLLQRDILERINPAIVEAFLDRIDDTDLVSVRRTAAGEGFLELRRKEGLPGALGGRVSALVATSGAALRKGAGDVDASRALPLGPGEPAFSELITLASRAFEPDLYRGGAAEDPTSITAYDLYVFEGLLSESEGRRSTAWAMLVRVDDSGYARPVRWESLANLMKSSEAATARHPARLQLASEKARELAADIEERQRRVRADWFSKARSDLQNLPVELTKGISEREKRVAARNELSANSAQRLARLESLSKVSITPPTLTGYLRVYPAAPPLTIEEKDSENIAMRFVTELLTAKGWKVSDVHTENRGYDLLALRGREQRLVEVKGVWGSAASAGISMTGNEVLIATQHGPEYWLYVIDRCEDGFGTLFGEFRDPATTFSAEMRAEALFKVLGSSLTAARERLSGDSGWHE
jgi:superfamily II DNA or RNA helicase